MDREYFLSSKYKTHTKKHVMGAKQLMYSQQMCALYQNRTDITILAS
jgi:hypothetical protein